MVNGPSPEGRRWVRGFENLTNVRVNGFTATPTLPQPLPARAGN
jgi:hypothetical protein